MNMGVIPPTINLKKIRKASEGLVSGRIKVVTEPIEWPEWSPFGAVNSFGFGGANGHILLRRYPNQSQPIVDQIPRLICLSGSTQEAVQHIQAYLSNSKINYNFIRLLQEVYGKNIPNCNYRGFSIVSEFGEVKQSVTRTCFKKKNLHIRMGGKTFVKNCEKYFEDLKMFPKFRETISICNDILLKHSTLIKLTSKEESYNTYNLIKCACTQIGIIDLLREIELYPDYVEGSFVGKYIVSYAQNKTDIEHVLIDIINNKDDLSENDNNIQSLLKYKDNDVIINMDPVDVTIAGLNFNIMDQTTRLDDFLFVIGRLYELGFQPKLHKLYPTINLPLDRGTPMLSHLIKWNHKIKFSTNTHIKSKKMQETLVSIHTRISEFDYLKGHVIDGRNLLPATGYLLIVWKTIVTFMHATLSSTAICFKNVKFHKATIFHKDEFVIFSVNFKLNGEFELTENDIMVVSGHAEILENKPKIEEIIEVEDMSYPKLTKEDVYKELKLRGYNYKGLFCGIHEYSGSKGLIEWNGVWDAFLDCMLQLAILNEASRALKVPTSIEKLVINGFEHTNYINKLDDKKLIPVYINKHTNVIKTQFIEIQGLVASTIPRRREVIEPVLESYEFIPNDISLSLEESVRINIQIILENKFGINIKVLEFIEDPSDIYLSPYILNALDDAPMVIPNLKVISKHQIDIENVEFEVNDNINVITENNNLLFIGSNIFDKGEMLETVKDIILADGFLLTIEKKALESTDDFIILTTHNVGNNIIYLMRVNRNIKYDAILDISNIDNYEWIHKLKSTKNKSTLIYCDGKPLHGILGFTNCIRREPAGENIACAFIQNNNKLFNMQDTLFSNQFKKGMAVNVLKDGKWGTYRHLKIAKLHMQEREHCYANILQHGDLSTLKWVEGPMKYEGDIIKVHNSALNFKDLMIASGKIALDTFSSDRWLQLNTQGMEYSGINHKGERIMGIVESGGISTLVKPDKILSWIIPSNWTFEDAATVPIVYSTVLMALEVRANVKRGQSILIHSGTGGIGLAAINIALHYELEIFLTVGTNAKREYLHTNFPQIKKSNIGSSRDISFKEMIFEQTKGRGVDIILNSLADEKLQASVACLALGGIFLEIGKFDISLNNSLAREFEAKGATFTSVMLDKYFYADAPFKMQIQNVMNSALKGGYIKPLPRTCYPMADLEKAYRFIGTGNHIGKIVFAINKENAYNNLKPMATLKFFFNPNASYIILGGLGGFGLELIDWMVVRQVRYLVLSTSTGLKTGYQKYVIRKLEQYKAKVVITKEDISTEEGCKNVIKLANDLAPVEGIFNLAVKLRDDLFENLSSNDYDISLKPKAIATKHMDTISRQYCPNLKLFIVFSSVSCGRGNAGQTNYGLSNSIMERICEKRKEDGYPALAIQWGAVGDVGLVAEMHKDQNEVVIGGTLQQGIASCLNTLDSFLVQDKAIVSSILVAAKRKLNASGNIVETLLDIIGIKDVKTVSLSATLPELGMDSMMSVEIKQILERDFDLFLTPQHVKTLTVAKLYDLQNTNSAEITNSEEPKLFFNDYINNLFNPKTFDLPFIKTLKPNKGDVILLPGIEGVCSSFSKITEKLKCSSTCLQYICCKPENIIDELVSLVKPIIESNKTFNIVAHSIGTIFALEIASKLEHLGFRGNVVLLDGSPYLINTIITNFLSKGSTADFETELLGYIMNEYLPANQRAEVKKQMLLASNLRERQLIGLKYIPESLLHFEDMILKIGSYINNTFKALAKYTPSYSKIESKVYLFKPKMAILAGIEEDLQLKNYCENLVDIKYYPGSHMSFTENLDMIEDLNTIF